MIRRPSKGTRDVSGYMFDTISKVDQSYTSRFFTRVLPSVHEDKREMIFVFLWIVARYLVSGSLTLYSRISFHDFYWKKFSSIWLNERLHECNFLLSFNSSSVSFFSSFSSTFSATSFLSYIILYYYNTRNYNSIQKLFNALSNNFFCLYYTLHYIFINGINSLFLLCI